MFDLERDGAQLYPALGASLVDDLDAALGAVPASRPGWRIAGNPGIAGLIGPGTVIGGAAGEILGAPARAVRAIFFDKSAQANWSLDWHQDRTIAVAANIQTAGFGNWNIKQGICHVEPPFGYIERMVTVRVHLDTADETNGALEIALGSHRLGRLEERDIASTVQRSRIHVCLASRADAWFYRTPILHRSARSTGSGRRRVLQVDYSADGLPGSLDWCRI